MSFVTGYNPIINGFNTLMGRDTSDSRCGSIYNQHSCSQEELNEQAHDLLVFISLLAVYTVGCLALFYCNRGNSAKPKNEDTQQRVQTSLDTSVSRQQEATFRSRIAFPSTS